jgi:hypothetical protein
MSSDHEFAKLRSSLQYCYNIAGFNPAMLRRVPGPQISDRLNAIHFLASFVRNGLLVTVAGGY